MTGKVKAALRTKTTAFDAEIEDVIGACKADLELVGIRIPEVDDPLITRAVILYAKAHFGFSDDSEKYQRAYDALKCSLSLAGDYSAVE